jgi:Outer membrane protein beta-barrel domain
VRAIRSAVAVLLAALATAAGAQTMLDQQLRLIDIHDLLLDLPPVEAPGALAPLQVALGGEVITIPSIDGTTGGKKQIAASDQTPLYPRPRLMLGLPAPAGFRAFVGIAYIPPFTINEVSTNYGAIEAGFAYAPGAFAIQLRGHALHAFSKSPVTDPATIDTLETTNYGGDALAGYELGSPSARFTPYAGVGVTHLHGRFRVSSDGVVLTSDTTTVALHAGARALLGHHWEAVAELDAYPGLLVHPNFRLAYVFDLR